MTVKVVSRPAARGAVPLLLVASLVILGGSATAYWGASGAGSGSADTATTASLTLTPATPTAQLFPGGQATVVLTVNNPNVSSVRIGSLVRDTGQGNNGFAVDGAHSACGLAALSFTSQTNGGAGWTVAGNGSLVITLTNSLAMTSNAANACQGASFTVYLSATP